MHIKQTTKYAYCGKTYAITITFSDNETTAYESDDSDMLDSMFDDIDKLIPCGAVCHFGPNIPYYEDTDYFTVTLVHPDYA